MHMPIRQVCPGIPHAVPLAASGFEQTPVVGSHDPATWHSSSAVQVLLVPPPQTPAWQVLPDVHWFVSLQAVPSMASGFEHAPVPGSQVPATWHWSDAGHVLTVPPPQTPAWQVLPDVHWFVSLQAVPLATAGFEHTPVAGSHVPAAWHWSEAGHALTVPLQTPA